MRVLVTGDRDWDDPYIIGRLLDGYRELAWAMGEDLVVIEGGARGADEFAKGYRRQDAQVEHITEDAEWTKHGKGAGPIRNRKMIDEHNPDVVLAFHDDLVGTSKGTKDCVAYAKEMDIPVYLISRP